MVGLLIFIGVALVAAMGGLIFAGIKLSKETSQSTKKKKEVTAVTETPKTKQAPQMAEKEVKAAKTQAEKAKGDARVAKVYAKVAKRENVSRNKSDFQNILLITFALALLIHLVVLSVSHIGEQWGFSGDPIYEYTFRYDRFGDPHVVGARHVGRELTFGPTFLDWFIFVFALGIFIAGLIGSLFVAAIAIEKPLDKFIPDGKWTPLIRGFSWLLLPYSAVLLSFFLFGIAQVHTATIIITLTILSAIWGVLAYQKVGF